jgi:hypothetical protein
MVKKIDKKDRQTGRQTVRQSQTQTVLHTQISRQNRQIDCLSTKHETRLDKSKRTSQRNK